MKLRLLLFTALLMVLTTLKAAYFERLPFTITQPDGKAISCFVTGDEFFNWIHDANDYTIIQAPDGYYYYAEQNGDLVKPSRYLVNSVDPGSSGLIKGVKISKTAYNQKKSSMLSYQAESIEGPGNAPHTGEMNNLVVYIRFSDEVEFTTTRGSYDKSFNPSTGVTLKSYFQEASYNKLIINSTHYPACDLTTNLSYQDSHPRGYFQPYNATTNPSGYTGGSDGTERRVREHQLLVDAITWVNTYSPVPVSLNLDGDGDGNIDNVCFIIRGSSGGWAELLWAHRWSLYSQTIKINGKRVYGYTFQPENQVQVKTLCHEMFHALGSPDLYHYTNQGVISPVGSWDLMESGGGHMLSYMKWKYTNNTWISSIPEITTTGTYTLNPLTSSVNNCFKIASPYSTNEYFVAEYRNKSGTFEINIPGSGLIVSRIDTRETGNADGPPDEVYVYRPNGTIKVNGTISTAFLSSTSGRTALNDATNPTSFLQDGSIGGLNISEVSEAGATISFKVTFPVACTPPTKQSSAFTSSAITDNAMRVSWTRGNGDAVLVIARPGSAVNTGPVNGNTYTANSVFGTGTQIGTSNYVVYKGSGTSVNLTALNPGTIYYFAIYEYFSSTNCYTLPPLKGNGTTTGIPPYCTAGSSATTDEYISNVSMGSINQLSGRGTSGYQDFTSQVTTMQIGSNSSATIDVTNPYSSDQVLIWIDWNKDGDFTDSGENVYSSAGSFISPHTTTNFSPPAGAVIGTTRMRIRLHDLNYTTAMSCDNSSYGEVEDYSINVTAACIPPAAPTGPTAQAFCSGTSPTVASLTATGSAIKWYAAATGGTPLATTTLLANNTHYYASQTVSGCESINRLNITTTVNTSPGPPTPGTITQPNCDIATGSIVLNGLPPTGTWTLTQNPGGKIITGTGVTRTITGLTAGTYFFIVTNGSGCTSVASANVAINDQPATPDAPTGEATQTFCSVNSPIIATLTTTGTGIKWYNNATGGTPLTLSRALINGSNYYASQTVGACESSARLKVTAYITENPPTPTGASVQTFCAGNSPTVANLIATGNAIKWYTKAIDGSALSTTTPLVSGSHYYAGQTANGCESAVRLNVTVIINPQPPVPGPIVGAKSVCVGGIANLTNTTAGGIWSSSANSTATISPFGVAAGISDGTVSIVYTVTSTSGCSSSTSTPLTVFPLPITPEAIGGNKSVCVGNTTTLTNATQGGVWSSSKTSVATINTTGDVKGISEGTSTIDYTVTNTNGCSRIASTTVTVKSLPGIYAVTGGGGYCSGGNGVAVGLSGSQTGTNYQLLLNGSNSGTLVAGTGSAISFGLLSAAGIYTVTATNAITDCTIPMNGSATVTIYELPSNPAAIGGNKSVCVGGVTILSNTTSEGTWSSLTPSIASVNTTGAVTGLDEGMATIVYTVANQNGCTNSVSTKVTVNALPNLFTVNGGGEFCDGGEGVVVSLSGSQTGVNYQLRFNGTNTGTPVAGTVSGISFGLKSGAGAYTVMANNATTACVNAMTGSANITINELPSVPSEIKGATSVCVGSATTLTNITTGGVWSSSNNSIATISETGVVTGIAQGTVTIFYTVTNKSGCSNNTNIPFIVHPIPAAPVAIEGTKSVCAGSISTLTNATTGGIWSSSSNSTATVSPAGVVSGLAEGMVSITYIVSNASGCTNSSSTSFKVNALPKDPEAIEGPKWISLGSATTNPSSATTNLTNATTGGVWSSSSTSIATISSKGIVTGFAKGIANIFYTITNTSGCISSASTSVTVYSDNNELIVYPNPTAGSATFEFHISENAKVLLDIFSMAGQHIAPNF